MNVFQLSALAVTGALCALILRKQVPELALILALATGMILLGEAMDALVEVKGLTDSLARTAGLSPRVWKPVWKTVGIGVVSRLAAAVCRDAGEGGVAAFLETAGAALALLAALPLVEMLFDALGGLL